MPAKNRVNNKNKNNKCLSMCYVNPHVLRINSKITQYLIWAIGWMNTQLISLAKKSNITSYRKFQSAGRELQADKKGPLGVRQHWRSWVRANWPERVEQVYSLGPLQDGRNPSGEVPPTTE